MRVTNRAPLLYLEHSIHDGSRTHSGENRTISKRMLYVGIDSSGNTVGQEYAPYLDYRPLSNGEPGVQEILARPECGWISGGLEATAVEFAVSHVVPAHLEEVRSRKLELLLKTEAAVKERLTKGDRLLGSPRQRPSYARAGGEA